MYVFYMKVISILFLLMSLALPAKAGQSKVLRVAVGDAQPPWVFLETDKGIVLDILKETLGPQGYDIQPVRVPLGRRHLLFEQGEVDVVIDINPNLIREMKLRGYPSVVAYSYDNVFIALHKNRYDFTKIDELATHRVVSWQNAVEMIGGEYADMARNNKFYKEVANQEIQLKVLYERNAIIQMDWNIFQYHRRILSEDKSIDADKKIDVFRLLKKNDCQYLFKDQKTQEAFNQNFEKLKSLGKYDEIIEKYTGSHE